jgi:hypothetical protein
MEKTVRNEVPSGNMIAEALFSNSYPGEPM